MKVAVLGAGIMGSGIAQLAAMHGYEVTCRDVAQEQLQRAATSVETSLSRFVKAEHVSPDDAAAARGRISFETALDATLENAGVVIEAVPEVLTLKQELLAEACQLAPDEALLGTNTSQLSITSIAAALGDNAPRLVGIHFFNPPVMMRLVELVLGTVTTEPALAEARAFAESLGREVVVCRKDAPGFITSRAYAILRLECMRMLEEGVASADDIDRAMRLGFNFPMGPLELGDMNGLDTFLHALTSLTEAYGERFRPTVSLRNMVAANRLGRKTGAGFYEYGENGSRTRSDPRTT
jgi:3-hydroxybutyryl-CoA dehydrogenase